MSIITCMSFDGSALKSCAKKMRKTGASLPVASETAMAATPARVQKRLFAFSFASSSGVIGLGAFAVESRGLSNPSPRHARATAPGRSAAGAM